MHTERATAPLVAPPSVMGYYEMWRTDGAPTQYGPLKTPVTADVLVAGFIYAIAALFCSLCLALIGVRGSQV